MKDCNFISFYKTRTRNIRNFKTILVVAIIKKRGFLTNFLTDCKFADAKSKFIFIPNYLIKELLLIKAIVNIIITVFDTEINNICFS